MLGKVRAQLTQVELYTAQQFFCTTVAQLVRAPP